MIPKILTKVLGGAIINMNDENEKKRIESEAEIKTYLDRLKYALKSKSTTVNFQKERSVDKQKNIKYTNRYTISKLFLDEDELKALRRELSTLNVDEYIETVKDTRFLKRSEMRVFGRKYSNKDVYIKIRVELINKGYASGNDYIMVMSFHFSKWSFKKSNFPYKRC